MLGRHWSALLLSAEGGRGERSVRCAWRAVAATTQTHSHEHADPMAETSSQGVGRGEGETAARSGGGLECTVALQQIGDRLSAGGDGGAAVRANSSDRVVVAHW